MPKNANQTRGRILEAASRLFYAEGIRAVSVDGIAEKAGITKRTLYYHFKSKDDLIAAYLAARDQPTLSLFSKWFEATQGSLADKIQAIFDNVAQSSRHPKWKGCGFLRTAAELANMPGHPAMQAGASHKRNVEDWLKGVIQAAGLKEAELLARQIVLLLDGAFASAMVHRDPGYIEAAGAAAATLIRSQEAKASGAAAHS